MREFRSEDIIRSTDGNWQGAFNEIINHLPELWQVSAEGWYFRHNLMKVGTLDECLNYLGLSSYEEYQEYYNNIHITAYDQGFWCFELKRVDLNEYVKYFNSEAVTHARLEWRKTQHDCLEKTITEMCANKMKQYKDAIIENAKKFIADQFDMIANNE